MTVSYGFPDYQQYPQWRGAASGGTSVKVTSSAPVTVAQYVTAYASAMLRVNCTAGTGVTVTVAFYTDSTLGTALGTWTYIITSGAQLNVLIPVLGNYLQIQITTGQSGDQTVYWSLQPTNLAPAVPSYPVPIDYGGGYDVGNPAGATFTYTMPAVCEGSGIAVVNPRNGGTKMTIAVVELTESGSIKGVLGQSSNPGAPVSIVFAAGRNPVQLQVTNTDTAAHQFDWSVSVPGRS